MKAVILISSIFYIIGLKVSNQIDLVGKSTPADTLISTKIIPQKPAKSVQFFQDEYQTDKIDSIKSEETEQKEDNQS